MTLLMRFYLKELKEHDDDRKFWNLIAYATAAVFCCFVSGICRERANFFTGATKAKAGQCLRSLVYKKIAMADFMFLFNVDAGLVGRFGMNEVDYSSCQSNKVSVNTG